MHLGSGSYVQPLLILSPARRTASCWALILLGTARPSFAAELPPIVGLQSMTPGSEDCEGPPVLEG